MDATNTTAAVAGTSCGLPLVAIVAIVAASAIGAGVVGYKVTHPSSKARPVAERMTEPGPAQAVSPKGEVACSKTVIDRCVQDAIDFKRSGGSFAGA